MRKVWAFVFILSVGPLISGCFPTGYRVTVEANKVEAKKARSLVPRIESLGLSKRHVRDLDAHDVVEFDNSATNQYAVQEIKGKLLMKRSNHNDYYDYVRFSIQNYYAAGEKSKETMRHLDAIAAEVEQALNSMAPSEPATVKRDRISPPFIM